MAADPTPPQHARVVETPPGYVLARTADGRELRFGRIALRERPVIGMPVLLRDLTERGGVAWANQVELDLARRDDYERRLAEHQQLIDPVPEIVPGVIEAVDGDAVRARLDTGEVVWFRASQCRDHRGHLGLRVLVTVAPRRVRTVVIAPEDVERNAELRRELEPRPLALIKPPRLR